MTEPNHPLETLQDIKQMMERSSRFISLSGLSGVAAGVCALVGAAFAWGTLFLGGDGEGDYSTARLADVRSNNFTVVDYLNNRLIQIAVCTFIAAFVLAFLFTYLRSRKNNIPVWGAASRRLMINMCIPLCVGGIFILKLIDEGDYALVAPGCLIFYGLALVNAGKYTLSEVRYLGYCELVLGLANLLLTGHSLLFWAAGFGVLHILYGIVMWWKYERKPVL